MARPSKTERIDLDDFLRKVKDGDERGWLTEFEWLRRNHGHQLRALIASVLRIGIQRPILVGPDGRCWDGHHRVYVAWVLGLRQIEIEYAREGFHV